VKDARAVIHTGYQGGREKIEADGSHGGQLKGKTCSRIAVAAFSRGRWYLGTPLFAMAQRSDNVMKICAGGLHQPMCNGDRNRNSPSVNGQSGRRSASRVRGEQRLRTPVCEGVHSKLLVFKGGSER
jgi:hypothetical protein